MSKRDVFQNITKQLQTPHFWKVVYTKYVWIYIVNLLNTKSMHI